jgi:hypothetical protein
VDRLDVWLNAQRGWRRRAVIPLYLYPAAWVVCAAAWLVWQDLNSNEAPGVGSLYWLAGVSVPVTLLLAGLTQPVQAVRVRSRAKRGKPVLPTFVWRWSVFEALMALNVTFMGFFINQSATWKQAHRPAHFIPLVVVVGAAVLLLESQRYTRRVREECSTPAPPFPGAGQPLG